MTQQIVSPRKGLFLCSRTSSYDGEPCDGAIRITIINTDTRCCDDPKKIPANKGTDGDWYSAGTNHRVESGRIKRDMGTTRVWAVEVADLQEFIDRHGTCVVGRNVDGFGTIEIYDDYRE